MLLFWLVILRGVGTITITLSDETDEEVLNLGCNT